ncbi:30S ribosomal protein S9 [Candidatus Wolfebacteria bacterium]|nr:MAG: 30S ribosomal protein S9 [Candidatus Wolfebacteria bacterium]
MAETKSKKAYLEAVGRRKQAVARIRLTEGSKQSFLINESKDLATYFPTKHLQMVATQALDESEGQKFAVSAHVRGGGVSAQAEAVRHGIARALLKFDLELRKGLKAKGFLTRDQRSVERKKFGLKKARKAAQWSKR